LVLTFVDLRVVRASILADIQDLFAVPPANMPWSRAFNVYDILDMANASHVPVEPYVFLVAAHPEPTESRIPMVVVDTTINWRSYQLGGRNGAFVNVLLHCWGRTRAERDDIATLLANVYAGRTAKSPSISIWTSLDDTTEISVAAVTTPVQVTYPSAGDELSAEGTLRNWTIVSFGLTIR